MWRTQFERVRVRSNVGDPVHIIFSPEFDRQGRMTLVETGRENIYDFIQSHRDSVDIHVLLTKFQNGDASALSRTQGTYGDFTAFPKTYAEMLNVVIAGEQYFNSLPVEERAKYDHSYERFIASLDNLLQGKSPESVTTDVPVEPDPVRKEEKTE